MQVICLRVAVVTVIDMLDSADKLIEALFSQLTSHIALLFFIIVLSNILLAVISCQL